jgi:hypothetical protein
MTPNGKMYFNIKRNMLKALGVLHIKTSVRPATGKA